MGVLLACRLHAAGAEVTLLDYKPERAERLAAAGLKLSDQDGESVHQVAVSADPAVLAQCNLALVCVKAYRTQAVADRLAGSLAPQARVITLQNGAGNVEILVQALGAERVLGGITSEGATLLDEGHARHAGRGLTHLGPAQGEPDDFCRQAADHFQTAGLETSLASGVKNLIWTKLVINVGINALTALLDVDNGVLLDLPAASQLMDQAVAEAVAVGAARGISFLHEDMAEAVRDVARRTASNISSMRQDVRAKRQTEIDFINGAVYAEGRRLGVDTPINHSLTLLVRAKEQSYQGVAGS
jgi:2-dehydropantoate 2-reductase